MADLCFSEKMSKDDSKARATPQPFTPCGPLAQRGRQAVAPSSALKIPCKKIEPLKSCAFLRFAQECSAHSTSAAEMDIMCGDALFALAELA